MASNSKHSGGDRMADAGSLWVAAGSGAPSASVLVEVYPSGSGEGYAGEVLILVEPWSSIQLSEAVKVAVDVLANHPLLSEDGS